jgi:hypothetical protein
LSYFLVSIVLLFSPLFSSQLIEGLKGQISLNFVAGTTISFERGTCKQLEGPLNGWVNTRGHVLIAPVKNEIYFITQNDITDDKFTSNFVLDSDIDHNGCLTYITMVGSCEDRKVTLSNSYFKGTLDTVGPVKCNLI